MRSLSGFKPAIINAVLGCHCPDLEDQQLYILLICIISLNICSPVGYFLRIAVPVVVLPEQLQPGFVGEGCGQKQPTKETPHKTAINI